MKEAFREKILADAQMSKCLWIGIDIPREEKIMYLVLLPPASIYDTEFIVRFVDVEVHNLFGDTEYEIFEYFFFPQWNMELEDVWEDFEACGGSYIRCVEDYKPESEGEDKNDIRRWWD